MSRRKSIGHAYLTSSTLGSELCSEMPNSDMLVGRTTRQQNSKNPAFTSKLRSSGTFVAPPCSSSTSPDLKPGPPKTSTESMSVGKKNISQQSSSAVSVSKQGVKASDISMGKRSSSQHRSNDTASLSKTSSSKMSVPHEKKSKPCTSGTIRDPRPNWFGNWSKEASASLTTDDWSIEDELKLLYSGSDLKQYGQLKHFNMTLITERFIHTSDKKIKRNDLWDKFNSWYNLAELDKRENGDCFDMKPFKLPRTPEEIKSFEESGHNLVNCNSFL